jgi:hypothetical protein
MWRRQPPLDEEEHDGDYYRHFLLRRPPGG